MTMWMQQESWIRLIFSKYSQKAPLDFINLPSRCAACTGCGGGESECRVWRMWADSRHAPAPTLSPHPEPEPETAWAVSCGLEPANVGRTSDNVTIVMTWWQHLSIPRTGRGQSPRCPRDKIEMSPAGRQKPTPGVGIRAVCLHNTGIDYYSVFTHCVN